MKRKNLVTTILTATVIALGFVSLIPIANAGVEIGLITFQTHGSGVANWDSHYNAHLYIAENPEGNLESWARVKVPYTIDFDAIESFSFDYYTENAYSTPYIIIEVDTDADLEPDVWVVQWDSRCWKGNEQAPTMGSWTKNSYDEWHDVGGLGYGHWTLAQEKDAIDGTVLSIKIAVGEWTWTQEHDCLVTNLTINGVELLPPAPVPVGGTIVPVNKIELLAPWIGLCAVVGVAVTTAIKRRKA